VLTPSLLSAVKPALERLIGYPYGCTEQTLSRFVPVLLAKGVFPREDLDELIEKGLDRLEVLRHEDGGWGFWTEDQSTVEMTGQVLLALTRAKALGVKINPAWIEGAVNWLQRNVVNADAWRSERIVALRALAEAERPMIAEMERFAAVKDLEPYQLAQLALAYQKLGERDEAVKLLARLKAKRIESGSIVRWERPSREYDWYYWWDDNPTLVTAVALEALAKLEPKSNLIPKAVNYLLQARRGDWWISTQDTAAIVIAALALPKPSDSSQAVKVLLNGQTLIEQTVDENGANLELDKAILGKLRIGDNTLEVKGDLNYATNLQFIREPTRLDAASNGIDVQRTYYKLEKRWNESVKNWDYIPEPLVKDGVAEPLEQGDLIVAKINIASKGNMRHMQIIEPVPAGFTAVNETGFDLEPGQPMRFQNSRRWWYWYSGRDIYQDRVEMFAGYFAKQQSLYVLLRANTPGTYTALPTNAELMYDPDVRGRSSAATLTIKE
jgi:alpha-2-macroglobulin